MKGAILSMPPPHLVHYIKSNKPLKSPDIFAHAHCTLKKKSEGQMSLKKTFFFFWEISPLPFESAPMIECSGDPLVLYFLPVVKKKKWNVHYYNTVHREAAMSLLYTRLVLNSLTFLLITGEKYIYIFLAWVYSSEHALFFGAKTRQTVPVIVETL